MPDDSGVVDQSHSEMSNLTGDFNRTASGDTKFSDMDAPVPDDSGVANQSPSEMSDLTNDVNRPTGTPFVWIR